MKTERQKHSRWLYIVLIVLLMTFLGFSTLPIVNSIIQVNKSISENSSVVTQNQLELETQAQGYEIVLQREPENQTALRGLLDVRLQQGDIEGAIAPLAALAKLNPTETQYTVLLAQTKQQVGDFTGAIATYKELLATQQGNINALQGLTNLLIQQNQGEEAISTVLNALKNTPDNTDSTSLKLLLGQVYALQQKYTEALAVYDQLIEADKEDFRPVLSKALVLQNQGKQAEAESLFTTAASLAPEIYKSSIEKMANKLENPLTSSEDSR